MQVSASTHSLALSAKNPGKKRVEKPTDYVGELATTGKGIGIAVIDSGVFSHPDLNKSLAGTVTFESDRGLGEDTWGHGTGTAGIIAGDGSASQGEIKGVAPGAKVYNLRVLTKQNNENAAEGVTAMLGALDWAVQNKDELNIRIINISGAMSPIRNDKADVKAAMAQGAGVIQVPTADGQVAIFLDPLYASVKRAVEAGIVVVCAAGNDGPNPGTVWGTPNYSPEVITVGSLDTNGTPRDLSDDFIAEHSARGPTITGIGKPDLVAPGVAILMPASPGSDIVKDNEAVAAAYQTLASVPDDQLLLYLSQAVASKQMSSKAFANALPELSRLLPEQFRARLQATPAEAQPAMALRLTGALAAKGVLDVQGDLFKAAGAALREAAAQGLAPKPALGDLGAGQPAYLAQDGTSFAAPIVTSIVAHMFEVNPNLTPAQVKDILTTTARAVPGADKMSAGAGALDAQAAISRAREMAAET